MSAEAMSTLFTATTFPLWPAAVLQGDAEARRAVEAVLAGATRGLDEKLARRIAVELTALERAAFAAPADERLAAVRNAAALRWRLGIVAAAAPEHGLHDEGALESILAETDAVLAELQRAVDAPASLLDVAAIRASLIGDAISLQSAAQRLTGLAVTPPMAEPSAPRPPKPRLVAIYGVAEPAWTGRRRPAALWALLALAALAAGGYRLAEYARRPLQVAPMEGAPIEAVAGAGIPGQTVLFAPGGRPLAEQDLAKLREAQAERGMAVRELAPGVYGIERQPTDEVKR